MDWLIVLSWLGVNSLFYALDVALFMGPETKLPKHPRLESVLSYVLFVLSLPGSLLFMEADRFRGNRIYDRVEAEKKAIRDEYEGRIRELEGKHSAEVERLRELFLDDVRQDRR